MRTISELLGLLYEGETVGCREDQKNAICRKLDEEGVRYTTRMGFVTGEDVWFDIKLVGNQEDRMKHIREDWS